METVDYVKDFEKTVIRCLVGKIPDDCLKKVSDAIYLSTTRYDIVRKETEVGFVGNKNNDLINYFLDSLRLEHKSPGTIFQYRNEYNKFLDYVQKDLDMVTKVDIKRYLAYLSGRIAARSVNTRRNYISSLFKFLYNEDYLTQNPMRGIKQIKFNAEKKKPFTPTEVAKLRDACVNDLRDRAIVEFLIATGIRAQELCDMQIHDVDFVKREVRVAHGKGDKFRSTAMTQVCSDYVQEYLKMRIGRASDDSPYLFVCKKRARQEDGTLAYEKLDVSGLEHIISSIGKKAGVKKAHPHKFRHTFASDRSRAGMPIQHIKTLMGHESLDTTMIYAEEDFNTAKISYDSHSI